MNIRVVVSQLFALARKDMTIWRSYRSAVAISLTGVVFGLLSWAVLGHYANHSVPEYNTDYVSFLIIGILVFNFSVPLATALQNRLNPWTIETVFMSGLRRPVFVVGSVLWSFIFSSVTLIPQLLIAVYWFGVQLDVNIVSVLLAFAISTLIIMSLAMLDMGIRVVTKATDPIMWGMIVAQGIASGQLYPIQTLNNYFPGASTLSFAIPFTWIYHLVRLSVLAGGSLTDPNVALSFLLGAAYCALLLLFCYSVMNWGINRAKKDGTLGWY
jgi:ABC-2 type transport system permease protein